MTARARLQSGQCDAKQQIILTVVVLRQGPSVRASGQAAHKRRHGFSSDTSLVVGSSFRRAIARASAFRGVGGVLQSRSTPPVTCITISDSKCTVC